MRLGAEQALAAAHLRHLVQASQEALFEVAHHGPAGPAGAGFELPGLVQCRRLCSVECVGHPAFLLALPEGIHSLFVAHVAGCFAELA
jgi:hypothetical protein